MRLIDGAEAIRGDLPASATRVVEVPVEAGESLDTGVMRFSSLVRVRERMREALQAVPDWALTVGGDCAVSLTAVEHAMVRTGGDLAVVWFDAHPDLNTPESSPSGAFNGMVLRALIGEGVRGLIPDAGARVLPERIVLGGLRDVDPGETRFLAEHGLMAIDTDDLQSPELLVEAVRETGASRVFVHIDLDVLDPSTIAGLASPLPFGLSIETLTELVTALRAEFPLAGASIVGFSPVSPLAAEDDLPSILRIIGALTR
ncbi:arginase family protein [Luethyella okanaganae]|uniref:Arginase family protein n=1 Tax=Luethyella okanaganae TaxID=69372 RepID=A0ABW1VH73_9MICO